MNSVRIVWPTGLSEPRADRKSEPDAFKAQVRAMTSIACAKRKG